jgi:hypothetical protein
MWRGVLGDMSNLSRLKTSSPSLIVLGDCSEYEADTLIRPASRLLRPGVSPGMIWAFDSFCSFTFAIKVCGTNITVDKRSENRTRLKSIYNFAPLMGDFM